MNWKTMLKDRLISFSFILALGFLLISFGLTTALSVLVIIFYNIHFLCSLFSDFIISFGYHGTFFAIIFKYLPDAKIQWKTVWLGALHTALLFFGIGKVSYGEYISDGKSRFYGALGSIVLVLIWVSYSV
jgi:membrane protein